VLLFLLVTGFPPFKEALPKEDQYFRLIASGRTERFWAAISKCRVRAREFSEGFKELVTGMLQKNPNLRLSLGEVMEHSWFSGTVATNEEVISEFGQRVQKVKEGRRAEKYRQL